MSSASDSPILTGYVSGDIVANKYRLKRIIGEGGMGSVWIAENVDLAADVALKLIRADVAESGANERFLGEARLAARLKHPAIVSVFDFGKTNNEEPFIVMELLQGETLGQYLARLGTVEPAELLRTLLPIIDALHLAHGHNVVHRDLKPDNVFISRSDSGEIQPKLLDFGIAKLRGTSAFKATKLTQAGTLIGSPDYMSPEQARGEDDLDARSDVWALCVLAYECLVGKPPFHGDNYNALLWAIIHDEPVPSTVYQAGDSELWRLLKRGFAKDRADRWNDAKQLGEAFAHWLESNGIVEDICHRSLHASWLPAERPTRPEMAAPFYPLASTAPASPSPSPSLPPSPSQIPQQGPPQAEGPFSSGIPSAPPASFSPAVDAPGSLPTGNFEPHRAEAGSFPPGSLPPDGSSPASLPPPTNNMPEMLEHPANLEFRASSSSHSALTTPTRAMVWRPHTRSIWFAAGGVLTLVAAVVLSDDGMPDPMQPQVLTPQQVQPLQASGSRPVSSRPNRVKTGDPPIGETSDSEGNSQSNRLLDSLEESQGNTANNTRGGSSKGIGGGSLSRQLRKGKPRRKSKGKTLRVRDLREIHTPVVESTKKTAPTRSQKSIRRATKKSRQRRVPQPKKKPDEPFDFGI